MLAAEWDWATAEEVWREESFEKGVERGREKGLEMGREETARNALAKGLTPEFVRDITGLDMDKITALTYTVQA